MASIEYKPICQVSGSSDDLFSYTSPGQKSRPARKNLSIILLLSGSLLLNSILIFQKLNYSSSDFPSKYASLKKNIPTPFSHDTIYTNPNQTLSDLVWSSPNLLPDTGLVALSDSYVLSKGLLPAQRWPWDHTKGIYLLNAFHNLHCLHVARQTILEAYDSHPLTYPLEHVTHCLNVLREEIMCNADDTPRYTGPLNAEAGKEHPTSGIGEIRMCRDWDQLLEFAVEKSACYRAINETTPNFPVKERYKFCPDGRVLWDE